MKKQRIRIGSLNELPGDAEVGTKVVAPSGQTYEQLPHGLWLLNGTTYIAASNGEGPMNWHGPR